MKIAIDIDNTMFTSKSVIYQVLNKIQKLGSPKAKKLKFKTIQKNESKENLGFINFILPIFHPKSYVAFKDAVETINEWLMEGNEIILLSNRPSKIKALKTATLKLLEKFNVKYSKLVLGCKNKHLYCKEFGVDLLIDDKLQTCLNCAKNDIFSICINEQKKCEPTKNLFFAENWKSVNSLFRLIEYFNQRKKSTVLNVDYNKYDFSTSHYKPTHDTHVAKLFDEEIPYSKAKSKYSQNNKLIHWNINLNGEVVPTKKPENDYEQKK